MIKFWENVHAVLVKRKISYKEIAAAAGVSGPAAFRYKHGAVPGLDVAIRVAEHLGLSMDGLVWGAGDSAEQRLCPSPGDHSLLKDLAAELGLRDLLYLGTLGTKSASWQILDVVAEHFPRPITLKHLMDALPEMTAETLTATVLSLKRNGALEEQIINDEVAILSPKNVATVTTHEIGDFSQHVRRAVKMLFGAVMPALERPGKPGHLVTFSARISGDKAKKLADELNALVKRHAAESCDDDPGDTDIHLVFGVAYSSVSS